MLLGLNSSVLTSIVCLFSGKTINSVLFRSVLFNVDLQSTNKILTSGNQFYFSRIPLRREIRKDINGLISKIVLQTFVNFVPIKTTFFKKSRFFYFVLTES